MSNILVSSVDGSIMIPKKRIRSFGVERRNNGGYSIFAEVDNAPNFIMGTYSSREIAIKRLDEFATYCYDVIAFEGEKSYD